MKQRQPTLRKAAILIASLDGRTARHLLEQMGPEQAQRVREAVEELDDIDPAEQAQVIEEFCRVSPLVPNDLHPGIELDSSLAAKLSLPAPPEMHPMPAPPAKQEPAPEATPFRFLHEARAEMLTPYLEREHPQTVAVVISYLPPAQAANVLATLPAALQAEVLRRLANLDEADPEVIREVEQSLEHWLTEQVKSHHRREAGMNAVKNILQAAGGSQRQILANLTHYDQDLAGKLTGKRPTPAAPAKLQISGTLAPKRSSASITIPLSALAPKYEETWTFDDVQQLDDDALPAVFQAAGMELTVLALAGASAEFVERLAKRLPSRDAKQLRKSLAKLVPTRLSDVEQAQHEIAVRAHRLADAGRILAPQGTLLAAA